MTLPALSQTYRQQLAAVEQAVENAAARQVHAVLRVLPGRARTTLKAYFGLAE